MIPPRASTSAHSSNVSTASTSARAHAPRASSARACSIASIVVAAPPISTAYGPWSPNAIATSAGTALGAVYGKWSAPPPPAMNARFDAPYAAAVT